MKKQIHNLIETSKQVTTGFINTGVILSKDQGVRLQICMNCPEIKNISWCQKCGCYMPLKTKFEFANCPLNKW